MELNPINISLYSLFHHNVSELKSDQIEFSKSLYNNVKYESAQIDSDELNQNILGIIEKNLDSVQSEKIGITLTGGLDSRIILASLLHLGVKPICICYGNELSRDVQIAKEICQKFGLEFYNPISDIPETENYKKWIQDTLDISKGNAHLHRAHRNHAIYLVKKKFDLRLLFTGHFGSETIRGYSSNNYMTSIFFREYLDKLKFSTETLKSALNQYFVRTEELNFEHLESDINKLSWMSGDKEESIFFYLQNLVKEIHHNQDIELFQLHIPKICPLFMLNETQEIFSKSEFHYFRNRNNNFHSLNHLNFYYQFIRKVYPPLLSVHLANGYLLKRHAKGKFVYAMNKVFLKYFKKVKSIPSFNYQNWYSHLLKTEFNLIDNEIWKYYDQSVYFASLCNSQHKSDEGYWHKYSNPYMFSELLKLNCENSNS